MSKKSEYSRVAALGSTPWVVLIHGSYNQIQTFYNPLDGSLHHRSIPELQQKICFGCSGGHLMLVDSDSSDCCLLNLTAMEVISLPPLTPTFREYCFFFLLSSSLNHVDSTVFVVKHVFHDLFEERANEIMMWRTGDRGWRILHRVYVSDLGGIMNGIVRPNGDVYLHGALNKLIVIDVSSLAVRLIDAEAIVRRGDHHHDKQILLESRGELFVVDVHLFFPYRFLCAEVYKLSESEVRWERVESIGKKRAIFLGSLNDCNDEGYMVDDPRVKGDCIYFVKSSYDGMRLYRFSLGESEIIFDNLICPKVCEGWYATKSCYLAIADDQVISL